MGNSAGGNLAATLTLLTSFSAGPNKRFRDELPDEFKQKLQVLLYPSVNTGVPYGERWRRSEPKVQEMSLPITVAELMEDCYLPPYIEREHILIRPIVAETELLASLRPAPALVLTAGLDCLKQEAIEYAKLLAAAGVQVEIHDYLEAKHGFSHYKKGKDFRPDDVKDCWDRIVKALAMALKD
jgi:acetyl esterase/lipase